MVRAWLAIGIAGAVLFGPYFCAWAQDLEPRESIVHWSIRSEMDPIFDTENVYASLLELRARELYENHDERINDGFDRSFSFDILLKSLESLYDSGTLTILYFRCLEGKLSAYVNWGTKPLRDSEKDDQAIVFRFDALEPQEEDWNRSTDHIATFAPNALKFMIQATMHERLAVRTAGSEGQLTAIFDLEGAREVVSRVFGACNIPEDTLYEDVFDE